MPQTHDCIAIVVSAAPYRGSKRERARSSKELSEAKILACQDVLSDSRMADAEKSLKRGMKVLFHQGGSTEFDGEVPGVGRLAAAARLGGIVRGLIAPGGTTPPLDCELKKTTRKILTNWEPAGYLWFSDVRRVPKPKLTKCIIGRQHLQQNYVARCPGQQGYDALLKVWRSAHDNEVLV